MIVNTVREAERKTLKVLEYYESLIRQLTRYCPYLYKFDIQQELRTLVLIRLYESETGDVKYDLMVLQLIKLAKRCIRLEKTRGMTYLPKEFDFDLVKFKGSYNMSQLCDGRTKFDNEIIANIQKRGQ